MYQREELSDGGWFCFGGSRFREAEAVEEVGNMAEAVDDEHLQQTNPDTHFSVPQGLQKLRRALLKEKAQLWLPGKCSLKILRWNSQNNAIKCL